MRSVYFTGNIKAGWNRSRLLKLVLPPDVDEIDFRMVGHILNLFVGGHCSSSTEHEFHLVRQLENN